MNNPVDGKTIVIIDDDSAMRLSCGKILSKVGLNVEAFADGARGLEGVARLKPDLVLVDLKMPGLSGIEVISRVHELDPEIIVVVITGYATVDTAIEAMKHGAYDFLPKPFSPDELRLIVNRGLERRRLALEAHRQEIEREVMRRRFVTFVSHQLRTPLVAIHQYLAVLKTLDDSEEMRERQQEWLDRCLKRTEEMQSIIQDWLTLSQLERGSLAHERVRVDLRQVVGETLETYEEMAQAEKVTLESRLPENTCIVGGDRNCLAVLFDNLIVNAINYNKPGGRVTVEGEQTGGEVLIAVSDTGIGIPEQYCQRIFDEFFRVKGEDAKNSTGTGLGLPICRRIVHEMGGAISVESQEGAGSTFRVRLPAWQEQLEIKNEELKAK
jgi:two-component system sensor histidine kinase/response regulator